MTLRILDHPVLYFVVWFAVLLLAALIGKEIRRRRPTLGKGEKDDLNLILSGTLTLVSLIVGFSFSMAVSRYDARKNLEAHEANVIRIAYERAELLRQPYARDIQAMLRTYIGERISLYGSGDEAGDAAILNRTFDLQRRLWDTVKPPAIAEPNEVTALAAESINQVVDAESATQAAWQDRIPLPAWVLMVVMTMFSCTLIGYYEQPDRATRRFYLVMPALLAVALFMIADLDSARSWPTMIAPVNLVRVEQLMH
ncbi:MAG: hypothetical protein KGN02_05055 [bacterium]|nr:hypothetical protein [bacterium]